MITQYLLDITICWSLFLITYGVFFAKSTFFKSNRIFLIGSLLLSLLLPLLRLTSFHVYDQKVIEQIPLAKTVYVFPEMAAHQINDFIEPMKYATTYDLIDLVWLIYFMGCGILFTLFARGLYRIYKLRQNGTISYKDNHTLVITDKNHLPFSFFNSVYISQQQMKSDTITKVLNHEIGHVQRLHSLDVIIIELVKIVFWFHPLLYMYKIALRQTHEFVADQIALDQSDKKSYSKLLLNHAVSSLELSLTNQFFHAHLKKRISMIYKEKSGIKARAFYFISVPLLTLLIIFFFNKDAYAQTFKNTPFSQEKQSVDDFENLNEMGYSVSYPFIFQPEGREKVLMQIPASLQNKYIYNIHRNSTVFSRSLVEKELEQIDIKAISEGAQYVHKRAKLLYDILILNAADNIEKINAAFSDFGNEKGIKFNFTKEGLSESIYEKPIPNFPQRFNGKSFDYNMAIEEAEGHYKSINDKTKLGVTANILELHFSIMVNRYPNHEYQIIHAFNTVYNKYAEISFNKQTESIIKEHPDLTDQTKNLKYSYVHRFLPRLQSQRMKKLPMQIESLKEETDERKLPLVFVNGLVNDFPLGDAIDFSYPVEKYAYLPPEKAILAFGEAGKHGLYVIQGAKRPSYHPFSLGQKENQEIENFFSTYDQADPKAWGKSVKTFYDKLYNRRKKILYPRYKGKNTWEAGFLLTKFTSEGIKHGITFIDQEGKMLKVYAKDANDEYQRIDEE